MNKYNFGPHTGFALAGAHVFAPQNTIARALFPKKKVDETLFFFRTPVCEFAHQIFIFFEKKNTG